MGNFRIGKYDEFNTFEMVVNVTNYHTYIRFNGIDADLLIKEYLNYGLEYSFEYKKAMDRYPNTSHTHFNYSFMNKIIKEYNKASWESHNFYNPIFSKNITFNEYIENWSNAVKSIRYSLNPFLLTDIFYNLKNHRVVKCEQYQGNSVLLTLSVVDLNEG